MKLSKESHEKLKAEKKIDSRETIKERAKNRDEEPEMEHPYIEQVRLLREMAKMLGDSVNDSNKGLSKTINTLAELFEKQEKSHKELMEKQSSVLEVITKKQNEILKQITEKNDIPILKTPDEWEFTLSDGRKIKAKRIGEKVWQ